MVPLPDESGPTGGLHAPQNALEAPFLEPEAWSADQAVGFGRSEALVAVEVALDAETGGAVEVGLGAAGGLGGELWVEDVEFEREGWVEWCWGSVADP